MKTDHSTMKLGKNAVVHDKRTLLLANYLTDALPSPPSSCTHNKDITEWGMMHNDTIGDCTCAAVGHAIMSFTDDNADTFTPTDAEILTAYEAVSGYNPKTGKNDNGADCITVLNYWRNTGIAGHKIFAYAKVEVNNETHIKQGVELFGGLYIGLALPISAQNQPKTWSVVSGPDAEAGSWGGHCVEVIHYSPSYVYFVTWGEVMKMTWAFWNKYCDEAYVTLSPDFIANGKAPNGFDLAALQADLKLIVH